MIKLYKCPKCNKYFLLRREIEQRYPPSFVVPQTLARPHGSSTPISTQQAASAPEFEALLCGAPHQSPTSPIFQTQASEIPLHIKNVELRSGKLAKYFYIKWDEKDYYLQLKGRSIVFDTDIKHSMYGVEFFQQSSVLTPCDDCTKSYLSQSPNPANAAQIRAYTPRATLVLAHHPSHLFERTHSTPTHINTARQTVRGFKTRKTKSASALPSFH